MKKVLTVVGARPQFIKAAAVSRAMRGSSWCREVLVHTGQHYDKNMSGAFFDELDMQPPLYNLGVGSGSHAHQTGDIMKHLEPILVKENADLVIVYGDTNSTLAAALTASKLHIPVAHIEAGLRSFNRQMPEEVNRVVSDHVATLLFCPTIAAVHNLKKEGLTANVYNSGDVMFDVTVQFAQRAEQRSRILSDLRLEKGNYILATVHRAENTDDKERLENIVSGLTTISSEMPVVIPLHPRTRNRLHNYGLAQRLNGLVVIEPVGFLDMLSLEKNARLIATDSGGVQKEAYFHQVPCVTLRDETEWVETLEARWNVLADADTVDAITGAIRASMSFTGERLRIDEYGDGRASHRIVYVLEQYLAGMSAPHEKGYGKTEMINSSSER